MYYGLQYHKDIGLCRRVHGVMPHSFKTISRACVGSGLIFEGLRASV